MKNILPTVLIVLMSLGLAACDNQNEKQVESLTEDQVLIKVFKDSFFRECVSITGVKKEFCECSYSEIIKKYPEKELVNIVKENDNTKIEQVLADVPALSAKCVGY